MPKTNADKKMEEYYKKLELAQQKDEKSKPKQGSIPKNKKVDLAKNYYNLIDKNADALIKVMKKQGHTPESIFHTMVFFVRKIYCSLGDNSPKLSLPQPNQGEEK